MVTYCYTQKIQMQIKIKKINHWWTIFNFQINPTHKTYYIYLVFFFGRGIEKEFILPVYVSKLLRSRTYKLTFFLNIFVKKYVQFLFFCLKIDLWIITQNCTGELLIYLRLWTHTQFSGKFQSKKLVHVIFILKHVQS